VFLRLKRFLASNKYFWKYRHFFQKKIFEYSYGVVPRIYFNKIFKNIKMDSVLDFGCATGDKLIYFVNNGSKNVYGIDINSKAIKVAENKLKNLNICSEFSEDISLKKINKFLKRIKKKKFDLIIFDRVLYILKETEFHYVINTLAKVSDYIYINDFFLDSSEVQLSNMRMRNQDSGYVHSDFSLILRKVFFKPVILNKSPYKKVLFANSKSALYKNVR
jgi:SAM-dependent methyltransferase